MNKKASRVKGRRNFWDLKQFMHKVEKKKKGKGSYHRKKSKRNLFKELKKAIETMDKGE